MTLLDFTDGAHRFIARAAGVAIRDGWVLLHHFPEDTFWVFPGGRIAFHESAEAAVRRTLLEELGVEVHVDRLLWVIENLFVDGGVSYHRIGFDFAIDLPNEPRFESRREPFDAFQRGQRLVFQWFRLDEIDQITVNPPGISERLRRAEAGLALEYWVADRRESA